MRVAGVKKGTILRYEGELCTVFDIEHRTPGNYHACYQLYMKNMQSGKIIKQRFNTDAVVQEADVESKKVQYLYKDASGYHFMDLEHYDTIVVSDELVGDAKNYLKENSEVILLYCEHKTVALELPARVDLKVAEAATGVKGDTEGTARKQVTLETGHKINVPLFIAQGEIVRIDTVSGEYVGRA
ncbi:MAG: elongation factor P [Candidatus Omnitrophota bacterium]|nr:elongation factor P [Candidatus Omnitrophota bacterium]